MGAAENKELVRRFYEEVWVNGNLEVADEVFAPDYLRHDFRASDALPGPEGQKKIAAEFRAAFSDLRFEVELLIADGDYVVGRWTASGTNLWPVADRSSRRDELSRSRRRTSSVSRTASVAELWNHRDDLGLMQQVGAPIHGGARAEP